MSCGLSLAACSHERPLVAMAMEDTHLCTNGQYYSLWAMAFQDFMDHRNEQIGNSPSPKLPITFQSFYERPQDQQQLPGATTWIRRCRGVVHTQDGQAFQGSFVIAETHERGSNSRFRSMAWEDDTAVAPYGQ
ncbi:hypothetical protein [Neoasaia chiangmaiensis]|uniref:hypothetical protein n=1 Tax=Neoasaia chiangmaiensis TaxID=320497 RepID=UPI0011EA59BD|nr:hypothetical protein [Neoasaia chiangmaiensis]